MADGFAPLHAFMSACRERLDDNFQRWLPGQDSPSARLAEAMRYAVTVGGKRIRPILVYAATELAGGARARADVPASAIEILHTYSLVHDDLPAMDDDDLRRGQPTCHRAFDDATAILAGDTLHTLTFELLASAGDFTPAQRAEMIALTCRAAGASGMAAGQMIDMQATGTRQDLAALEHMHFLKTGRLITAALELGAVAAGADDGLRRQLVSYGDAIGLAFQIQDDILDVTAETGTLGKPGGSDLKLGKSTFPGLVGLDASRQRARELCEQACDAISGQGERAQILQLLARYIIDRSH